MVATPALFLAGQDITAAFLQSLQPQPWTAMTLVNSYTNTGGGRVTGQYRLLNSVTVEIIGVLTPGTLTNSTTVATLPAGFQPISTQHVPVIASSASSAPAPYGFFIVTTAGALTIFDVPSGTTQIAFHGFIALDA